MDMDGMQLASPRHNVTLTLDIRYVTMIYAIIS